VISISYLAFSRQQTSFTCYGASMGHHR